MCEYEPPDGNNSKFTIISMADTRKVTVSLSPMMYWAVKDLVAQRRYPSLSFCVEDLIRKHYALRQWCHTARREKKRHARMI